MDPITTAIVAALSALAPELVTSGLKDAYQGLKAVIRRKFGESSQVSKAVEALEADPGSKGQAAVLQEKVTVARASEDPDVMKALAELVNTLKEAKIGGEAVSNIKIAITGGTVSGVIGAQQVTVGSMTFGAPPRDTKG
jgi:hypothetical protein